MTKRKIVVRISNMNNEKCRTKAMKIAVAVAGVESVTLRGEEGDQMVVIGEGIDAVMLASSLRKSVGFADVLSVADLHQPLSRGRYGALATGDNVHDAAQGRSSSLAVVWRNDDSGGGADYNNNYGGGGGGGRGGGGGGQVGNYHSYHNHNSNYPYDNYYLGN